MTYEYICVACSHAWEAEQSISEAALTECPSCHKPTAKRQISGGQGFILKGGGWYADGYGSAKSGSPSSSESSSSTDKSPSDKPPSDKPKASTTEGTGKKADASSKKTQAKKTEAA